MIHIYYQALIFHENNERCFAAVVRIRTGLIIDTDKDWLKNVNSRSIQVGGESIHHTT